MTGTLLQVNLAIADHAEEVAAAIDLREHRRRVERIAADCVAGTARYARREVAARLAACALALLAATAILTPPDRAGARVFAWSATLPHSVGGSVGWAGGDANLEPSALRPGAACSTR